MDCLLTGTPENIIDPPVVAEAAEWTNDEAREAESCLFDDVMANKVAWDEDGSLHIEFAIKVKNILKNEDKSERLWLIEYALEEVINQWCEYEMASRADYYCEKYCEKYCDV
jgi:hypothetical protein